MLQARLPSAYQSGPSSALEPHFAHALAEKPTAVPVVLARDTEVPHEAWRSQIPNTLRANCKVVEPLDTRTCVLDRSWVSFYTFMRTSLRTLQETEQFVAGLLSKSRRTTWTCQTIWHHFIGHSDSDPWNSAKSNVEVPPGSVNSSSEPLDDYWEIGPTLTYTKKYGYRSIVSLSYN
jgi:hypothetical protein